MSKWLKLYKKTHEVAKLPGSQSRNLKLESLLQQVRDYLNKCGYELGKAKFPYSQSSKLTWKYLPNTKTNNPSKSINDYSATIINKDCIYAGMVGF